MDIQLVIFRLSGENYGVDVHQVQSIIPVQEIAAVPGVPPFIEGVINLRGDVVPVVDLRTRFQLPAQEMRKRVIVIVEVNGLLVGLVVDKVLEVTKIPETAVAPPSPLLTNVNTSYLRGIGKIDEENILILLDLNRIFSLEEYDAIEHTLSVEA
jgi:purine-binding chemotaxis protein CheW